MLQRTIPVTSRSLAARAGMLGALSSSQRSLAGSTTSLSETPATTSAVPEPVNEDSIEMLKDAEGFIQDVSQFYNQEDLSDLIIIVKYSEGEYRFPAHKFVLGKSSEYFKVQLYSDNWKSDANDNVLELIENDVCAVVFNIFLKFLYTGQVEIDSKSAIGILYLADKYQVTNLKRLSVNYMMKYSASPQVRNALSWYPLAKLLDLQDLRKVCFNTICWNIVKVSQYEEYMAASIDFIEDVLSSGYLVIEDEHSILDLLLKWLSVDDRFEMYITSLLPKIRFPMMSVQQLYVLETSEVLAGRDESRELLADLIGKAYRFRSLCPQQHDLGVSFIEDFYQPRNYRSLCVDNIKIGNTMRFGFQVDLRTYSGAVPSNNKDADWKMVYQKNVETWTMKLYSQESSFQSGSNLVTQLAVLIEDDAGDVLQCYCADEFEYTRSSQISQCQFDISRPETAKNLCVLLKPKPASHAGLQQAVGVVPQS